MLELHVVGGQKRLNAIMAPVASAALGLAVKFFSFLLENRFGAKRNARVRERDPATSSASLCGAKKKKNAPDFRAHHSTFSLIER